MAITSQTSSLVILDPQNSNQEMSLLDMTTITPGKTYSKQVILKNKTNTPLTNVVLEFWPGLKDNSFVASSGNSIGSVSVIRMDSAGTRKSIIVDKDGSPTPSSEELTLTEVTNYRGRCYRKWPGQPTEWADVSTGDVNLQSPGGGLTQEFYIGVDEMATAIKFAFSQFGAGYVPTFAYSTGGLNFTTLTGHTDGTSNFTQDGVLYLGTGLFSNWKKATFSGANMYWIKVTTSAVTQQAIASTLAWTYIYDFPHSCLSGTPTGTYNLVAKYFDYNSGNSTYSSVDNKVKFEYANWGRVVFDNSLTLLAGHTLRANYAYKLPPPGVYVITFDTISSCQVAFNGGTIGSPVGITRGLQSSNTGVISGLDIQFNDSTAWATDRVIITVSNALRYMWYALASSGVEGTYQNSDLLFPSSLSNNGMVTFYAKQGPPVFEGTADNVQYFEVFASGSEA